MNPVFTLATAALALMPIMAEAQTPATGFPAISGTRLDVTGRGEVKRVPDVALIGAGVVTQSVNAATAMQENAARMARVVAALRRAGLAEKDIATSAISLSPQYRYTENRPPEITGYQASNQVNIRFRDIGKSGAVLDVLVKEGANQINGPTLVIDQPQAAMDEARVAAIKSARQRAELYASATGLKVKRIVAISEGEAYSPRPMPMMAMSRSADAMEAKSEILPGEQAIEAIVSVVFELG